MDRIVHSSAVDIGGGRRGFRSKDTVAGIAGTVVTATHLNANQEEILAAIEKTGQVPSAADLAQLFRAMRQLGGEYYVAGGSANALTITPGLAFANNAQMIGVPIRVKIAATNTGPATLNTLPIVRQDGTALRKNDLLAGDIREIYFDGTSWRLFSLVLQTERTITVLGRVTAQYLPTGVETAIEWAPPAAGTDPLGWYNPAQPTRLTCPVGIDRAIFSFSIGFNLSSVGYRKGRVVVNGSAEGSGLPVDIVLPNSGDLTIPNGAGAPYPMVAGDYAQVLGFTNPGGPHLLVRQNTFFSVSY